VVVKPTLQNVILIQPWRRSIHAGDFSTPYIYTVSPISSHVNIRGWKPTPGDSKKAGGSKTARSRMILFPAEGDSAQA
jgi:hypothetical protein